MDPHQLGESGRTVFRYLAIMDAALAFGADEREVEEVACHFDSRRPRDAELADALADLILSRLQPRFADGLTF